MPAPKRIGTNTTVKKATPIKIRYQARRLLRIHRGIIGEPLSGWWSWVKTTSVRCYRLRESQGIASTSWPGCGVLDNEGFQECIEWRIPVPAAPQGDASSGRRQSASRRKSGDQSPILINSSQNGAAEPMPRIGFREENTPTTAHRIGNARVSTRGPEPRPAARRPEESWMQQDLRRYDPRQQVQCPVFHCSRYASVTFATGRPAFFGHGGKRLISVQD